MPELTPRIWQVGALCRAVADALDARFNPVAVRGEISGFSRASSGHCYFALKDASGQIRCAMFKRAASLVNFPLRDGDLVEVRGRLGLYEPRGDLQLIVEAMSQVGAGALFEQFLRLKAKLEAEGLFAPDRKRALPLMPRGIGVVTSLGAAALHDVVSALARRAPHVPVVVRAAAVQGANAPAEMARALEDLYALATRDAASPGAQPLDVILLVRGGGSIEDLWAFNDEALARVIAGSPVPVISGVGHETDFSIADFVADVRAPTPTAAAELVAHPQALWRDAVDRMQARLQDSVERRIDTQMQQLDSLAARLGRPSSRVAAQRATLAAYDQRLGQALRAGLRQRRREVEKLERVFPVRLRLGLERSQTRLARAGLRLDLLDPSLVLQRGYAWLSDARGRTVSSPQQVNDGQLLSATVAGGHLDLRVQVPGEKQSSYNQPSPTT